MTILARLYQRRGLRLETDEDWAKYEAHKVERKAKNVQNARDVLRKNGIIFHEIDHRVGTDKLVAFDVYKPGWPTSVILPFYPEIGQWRDADDNLRYGVRNLARYIKGDDLC